MEDWLTWPFEGKYLNKYEKMHWQRCQNPRFQIPNQTVHIHHEHTIYLLRLLGNLTFKESIWKFLLLKVCFACLIRGNWKSSLFLREIINLAPSWHPGMSQHLKVCTFIQSSLPFLSCHVICLLEKETSGFCSNEQFLSSVLSGNVSFLLSITIYYNILFSHPGDAFVIQKHSIIHHIVTGSKSSSKWKGQKASDCLSFLGARLHETLKRHGTDMEKQTDPQLTAARLRGRKSRRAAAQEHATFKLGEENNRRTYRVMVCHRMYIGWEWRMEVKPSGWSLFNNKGRPCSCNGTHSMTVPKWAPLLVLLCPFCRLCLWPPSEAATGRSAPSPPSPTPPPSTIPSTVHSSLVRDRHAQRTS